VVERAVSNGVTVRVLSVPVRRFPLSVFDGRRILREAVAGHDVVVFDSLASSALAPWIVLHRRRSALVASVHQRPGGTDVAPLRSALQRWLDRAAYRRCDRVIVPSGLLRDVLVSQGIDATAIRVATPGRDVPERSLGADAETADVGAEAAPTTALCVANWVERKGILALLDAVAGLDDDVITLDLVGDEDVDREFRDRVLDRLGRPDLDGRVRRRGTVAPGLMPTVYAQADIFVLPSTEEPYGMVYAEAMDAGLPIVGWDAGNLPNLIDDHVEGRLLPPGDVTALRDVLASLARDAPQRRALGTAARERARHLPTWDETARVFYDVCKEAMSRWRLAR
jgi:glycosyltransferase involved in cell wall biosynthesis